MNKKKGGSYSIFSNSLALNYSNGRLIFNSIPIETLVICISGIEKNKLFRILESNPVNINGDPRDNFFKVKYTSEFDTHRAPRPEDDLLNNREVFMDSKDFRIIVKMSSCFNMYSDTFHRGEIYGFITGIADYQNNMNKKILITGYNVDFGYVYNLFNRDAAINLENVHVLNYNDIYTLFFRINDTLKLQEIDKINIVKLFTEFPHIVSYKEYNITNKKWHDLIEHHNSSNSSYSQEVNMANQTNTLDMPPPLIRAGSYVLSKNNKKNNKKITNKNKKIIKKIK